ncbi:hypothetical protein CF335_g8138, partial [Tilletia laevis]
CRGSRAARRKVQAGIYRITATSAGPVKTKTANVLRIVLGMGADDNIHV